MTEHDVWREYELVLTRKILHGCSRLPSMSWCIVCIFINLPNNIRTKEKVCFQNVEQVIKAWSTPFKITLIALSIASLLGSTWDADFAGIYKTILRLTIGPWIEWLLTPRNSHLGILTSGGGPSDWSFSPTISVLLQASSFTCCLKPSIRYFASERRQVLVLCRLRSTVA